MCAAKAYTDVNYLINEEILEGKESMDMSLCFLAGSKKLVQFFS